VNRLVRSFKERLGSALTVTLFQIRGFGSASPLIRNTFLLNIPNPLLQISAAIRYSAGKPPINKVTKVFSTQPVVPRANR